VKYRSAEAFGIGERFVEPRDVPVDLRMKAEVNRPPAPIRKPRRLTN
jgi:hypothetical protein